MIFRIFAETAAVSFLMGCCGSEEEVEGHKEQAYDQDL